MERLKMMKEQLMTAVQSELGRLDQADSKELGEVVDMIKDLSEAVYYCTIVKSMEESEEGKKEYPMMYYTPMPMNYRDMDREYGRMYYEGQPRDSMGRFTDRDYNEYNYAAGGNGSSGSSGGSSGGGSRNYPIELRDYREGQSPLTRKTYMERKMHGGGDKATQMKELEKYMQELSQDLTEMVEGSSPDEKQMLKSKLSTLASKIV